VYIMCEPCATHNLRNRGGIELVPTHKAEDNEFMFTKAGNHGNERTAYRTPHPHTAMDRWVRCHLIGSCLVLGAGFEMDGKYG
jgi:succinylglutamate desuccinylase